MGAMKQPRLVHQWDSYWRGGGFNRGTPLGTVNRVMKIAKLNQVLRNIKLVKDSHILDVGCGSGRTLTNFRTRGYWNSVGIDNSWESMVTCYDAGFTVGMDVFQMDAANTSFSDAEFGFVFCEGMLEHFVAFMPFVEEMARVTSRYVCITEPNHWSLYGRFLKEAWEVLRQNSGGVREHSYKMTTYHDSFRDVGLRTVLSQPAFLGDHYVMLFEK